MLVRTSRTSVEIVMAPDRRRMDAGLNIPSLLCQQAVTTTRRSSCQAAQRTHKDKPYQGCCTAPSVSPDRPEEYLEYLDGVLIETEDGCFRCHFRTTRWGQSATLTRHKEGCINHPRILDFLQSKKSDSMLSTSNISHVIA